MSYTKINYATTFNIDMSQRDSGIIFSDKLHVYFANGLPVSLSGKLTLPTVYVG